ncbi:hypothetical protein KCP70_18520 [Salmonella enterica subsp. enterica]|nr:hypothetical protein KCP70_18520 [Salmonella enterica subsp. enterica]
MLWWRTKADLTWYRYSKRRCLCRPTVVRRRRFHRLRRPGSIVFCRSCAYSINPALASPLRRGVNTPAIAL